MRFRPALAATFLLAAAAAGCPVAGEGEAGEGEGAAEGEGAGEGEGEGPPPPVVCPSPLAPVDLAGALVVGDGNPDSCTEAAVDTILGQHPTKIAFNCGENPVTIGLTGEKVVAEDLVIDGGGLVTLSGSGFSRILRIDSSFELATPHVVVQRLGFSDGLALSNSLEGGGAAIFRLGGTLDVIQCTFVNNVGNVDGQDTAGGAIFSEGGGFTNVVDSTFASNRCSNGGALGNLGNDLVVVNASFDDNHATGNGGNPGNGGNGGTISIDGQDRTVTMCGVTITNSEANAFGGAVFRVAYSFTEPTNIDRTVIDGALIEENDQSMAGGVYLQGTVVNMTATTIINATAGTAGGAFFGPGATVNLTNVSFIDDVATSGLGGAVFISGVLGGSIVNATFAGCKATGDLAFGGAVVGDASLVTLRNTLIVGSVAGNGFNPVSCTTAFADGVGSFQFPVARAGGGSDDPDALCAPNVTTADVALDALDAAGVVPVLRPSTSSPAIGAGTTGCPDTDALGNARATPCTAGAVEVAAP